MNERNRERSWKQIPNDCLRSVSISDIADTSEKRGIILSERTIIISVGGSLIVPDQIDVHWLASFKNLIETYIRKNFRFII